MTYELANGTEPDGIAYRVHLEAPEYVVTVSHPDGRSLTERYRWTFEPRCGPDVADVAMGEEIMERLITNLRRGSVRGDTRISPSLSSGGEQS